MAFVPLPLVGVFVVVVAAAAANFASSAVASASSALSRTIWTLRAISRSVLSTVEARSLAASSRNALVSCRSATIWETCSMR
jgi:hypothetical protein